MEVYYLIVFFIFGLILGSFYNVVGYRLPNKMSLISPSSHCTNCNHKLTPIELIPVLSYLIQGGKCKKCKCKIAIFYPLFELFTGFLFALTYKIYGLTFDTFVYLIFISVILIITISDVLYMVIIDEVLIFGGICILILKVLESSFDILLPTLTNMLVPFLALLLIKILGDFIFKKESLGFGDIKLMLFFGTVLEWQVSVFTIFLSAFLALPYAVLTLKNNKSHEIPLGPFLSLAALICVLFKIDITFISKLLGF